MFSRPQDDEFDEEVRFHLDEETDAAIQAGLTREQARYEALRRLGAPPTLVKEECRDSWGMTLIDDVRRDVILGVRMARRQRVLASVIVATLTLAIGTAVTVFSIVDAWLIKSLAFPQADRLVVGLAATRERPNEPAVFLLYRDFVAWKERSHVFDHLSAAFRRSYLITSGSDATEAMGLAVSGEFFDTLRVQPQLGRTLSSADVGGPARVVLGFGLWQRQFGGRPSIVGTSITLNGTPHEVIGVMPRTFDVRLLDQPRSFDLWTLLDPHETAYGPEGAGPVTVVGRLRAGMSLLAAQSDVTPIQEAVEAKYTDGISRFVVLLSPLTLDNTRNVRATLITLTVATGCLFLIACLNVSTLLIGRGFGRAREAAIRAAVGCGRLRMMRQFLIETASLAVVAAAAGLVLSAAAIRLFAAWNPLGTLPADPFRLDWRVFLFAVSVTAAATMVAGLFPAIRIAKSELTVVLSAGGGRAATSAGRPRAQAVLLILQTSASLVLVMVTLLLVRTVSQLQKAPLGFDPTSLTVISVALPSDQFDSAAKRLGLYEEIAARLAAVPGVQEVAVSTSPPLSSGAPVSVRTRGPLDDRPERLSAQDVSANFFHMMRIPVVSGRSFDGSDTPTSFPTVVLNEAAASHLFGGTAAAMGRQVWIGNQPARQVVGVVGNTKSTFYNVVEWQTNAVVYLPATQAFAAPRDPTVRSFGLLLHVRAFSPVRMPDAKRLVTSVNPVVAVTATRDASALLADATKQATFRMTLLLWFAGAGILLATIGVYGIASQVVSARRREFGIRIALGADIRRIIGGLVGSAATIGAAGVALGVLMAVALRRMLVTLLYGIQPLDGLSLAAAATLLLTVFVVAALMAAWNIRRVGLTECLRVE
jgi:predicted permease